MENLLSLPVTVNYKGNDTIVLYTVSIASANLWKFWNAVDIVKVQGFDVKDIMVISEHTDYDDLTGDYQVNNILKVLLVRD